MNLPNDLTFIALLALAVLNLVCTLALVGLMIVSRVRERRSVLPASAARAEWASVDLLPRD